MSEKVKGIIMGGDTAALAFITSELEQRETVAYLGVIGPFQPPPPRRPVPPGPKRYEMNYDRMTCFDTPAGEDSDAPEEATEWISAQDYEKEIGKKDAEIDRLKAELKRQLVDESHGQECQLRYEKTPGFGCTCKRSEGK